MQAERAVSSSPTAEHGWGRAEWLRGLPSVALLLHADGARFIRAREPVAAPTDNPPIAVQAPAAEAVHHPIPASRCSAACAMRRTLKLWRELKARSENDALAGWIAIALGKRPPPAAQAEEIAAELAARESCNVRALALRAWPTLPAAEAGIRSRCYRLQAAARRGGVVARLGAPPPRDAALPSFLRSLPPQEDTF